MIDLVSIGSLLHLKTMPAELLPEKLRALRQTHQLTQGELAQRLGLARQGYISNLETGRKAPSLELVVRIADVFQITTDQLLRDDLALTPHEVDVHNQRLEDIKPPRLFGPKLRYLRLQHGVSQTDLASELELARQGYISNLEIGWRDPSLMMVVRVAEYFRVSTDYLLRDSIAVEAVLSFPPTT